MGTYVNHLDELNAEIFLDGETLMIRRPGDKAASPLAQTGDGLFSFGGQALGVTPGPDGTPRYVHVGGRALRRAAVRNSNRG